MKRILCILLVLLLAIGLFACTNNTDKPNDVQNGTPGSQTDGGAKATEEPPTYWVYDYPYGSLKLHVSLAMQNEPEDESDSLLFTDPEGAWTMRFTPLSVRQTEIHLNNLTNSTESKKTFGYYQNVTVEDRTAAYGRSGVKVTFLSFERNPDWHEASQGYTAGATEPHAYLLFDYGDTIIGEWGGLEVELALPKKSTDPIAPVLSDERVQTLMNGIEFIESAAQKEVSIPGLSVSFPARWTPATDGDQTIWSGISGETKGTVFFGSSIYADPKEAAGYLNKNYRTVTFGGREWYGEVRTSELSGSILKGLELFTAFTEFHALYMKLNLADWQSDADFWAYTETDVFKGIMESVVTDPASFHNPEDDFRDASGFEANNINELSGYTGTETDLIIPSVIGQTEIIGINTDLFKDNTSITSVVISEGVAYIEYGAFHGCTNLKSVVLPNSLTYIDYHAFEDCTALESVTFGSGIITIDNEAFRNCSALKDVVLPDTVQKIGNEAFRDAGDGTGRFTCLANGVVYGRSALNGASFREVVFGENADLSESSILSDFKGESVKVGDGCTAIGEYFVWNPNMEDTNLKTIALPDTVKSIGMYAFAGRLGVKEINLGKVETVGESAFYKMGLVDIVVPGTLATVPSSCFSGCPYVMTITIEEGVTFIDEWAFEACGKAVEGRWEYNRVTQEEADQHPEWVENGTEGYNRFVKVVLPSTLTKTGYGAFCNIIGDVYMLWVTSPDQFPKEYDIGTFASAHIGQVFFTQETIEAYCDQLDAIVSGFDYVNEAAWYDEGKGIFWTPVN